MTVDEEEELQEGRRFEIEIPDEQGPIEVEYMDTTADGRHVFRQRHLRMPVMIERFVWDGMRSSGAARRLDVDDHGEVIVEKELDPRAMLDPDDPSITVKERNKRLLAARRLKEATILQFYAQRYDDDPSVGRGVVGVRDFVKEHIADAPHPELDWTPHPATILRAIDDCGVPGSRPLSAFLDDRGKHDAARRWPEEVLEAAVAASTYYWSKRSIRPIDAIVVFNNLFDALLVEREKLGPITPENPYNRPNKETIRNWIKAGENIFSWASKYGDKEAMRRFRGRGRLLAQASRPLELVMFDHTRIDVWAVVQDDNGRLLFVERPWLTVGIDCYSRMVLGAVLTYEHPSIHSITECLRHVVRRKDLLIERFPLFANKGATDGYGKPITVIVDNGWEFTGGSFKTSCANAKIHIIWAPVKVPMFKAYVERLFGTMNQGIWHLLDGGIPLTPRDRSLLELEPDVEAVHDRQRLEDLLWQWIVTIYHMEVHSGIGMAPARKWREGIVKKGRILPQDARVFDVVLGFTRDCQLSAEGIFFDGERFHDPKITTQLLSDLAKHAKSRAQRSGVMSSKTVQVMVTANPGNADHVHVRNPQSGQQVKLPNWCLTYAKGTPWHVIKKIRAFAKKQNLAFHSDQEKTAARIAFMEAMGKALPGQKFAEQRKLAPLLDPRPELVPGNAVTVTELAEGEIVIHDLADEASDAERESTKAPRRGGGAATQKAVETRARNKQAKQAKADAEAKTRPDPADAPAKIMTGVDDAAERLAAIIARVNGEDDD